ncbi:DNA helicase [Nocardioides sp. BGMRC 2183]|nr:DNA helicase [Nocardioides sp. BGMRC 2183]
MSLRARWRAFADGLEEFYAGPYRRTMRRAQREEDDLFLTVVLAEALGVPDPAAYQSVELLPAVYAEFHDWHRRIGLDRSPLEHIGCC